MGANRVFVVMGLSGLAVLILAAAAYALVGPSSVEAAYAGTGFFAQWIPDPPEGTLASYLRRVDERAHAFLAVGFSIWSLCAAFYCAARLPLRWYARLACPLVVWIAVEHWAAPHLVTFLTLVDYHLVLDPDHLPTNTKAKAGFNSHALRCEHEPADFGPDDLNVIFLGDSFTFGMKLKPRQTFAHKVEARLRKAFPQDTLQVANFGWISSSPLLSYRRLVDIGEEYHPDLVVLCLDMTDFRDDLKWRAMLDRRGIFRLIRHLPMTMASLRAVAPGIYKRIYFGTTGMPEQRFFMSEAPLDDSREHMQALVENLARIDGWCRQHDARFVLIVLPRTYQYSDKEARESKEADEYTHLGPHSLEPFRFFEELAPQVDYPIHSLLKAFQETAVFPTAHETDPHWNDAGASVAARALTPLLKHELKAASGR